MTGHHAAKVLETGTKLGPSACPGIKSGEGIGEATEKARGCGAPGGDKPRPYVVETAVLRCGLLNRVLG